MNPAICSVVCPYTGESLTVVLLLNQRLLNTVALPLTNYQLTPPKDDAAPRTPYLGVVAMSAKPAPNPSA